MTTKDDKAPVRADDDGPELAAIAEQVRPVVDAGKGRALAFEVVRILIVLFDRRSLDRGTLFAGYLAEQIFALDKWLARAFDVESGEEQKREIGQRLTLLDVAGMADRIASAALCQARAGAAVPFERWVVFDIATALRRACGCSDVPRGKVTEIEQQDGGMFAGPIADQLRRGRAHTADTLLPLLIRDARRLCAAAKVDVAPIEAAIARHGGRPS